MYLNVLKCTNAYDVGCVHYLGYLLLVHLVFYYEILPKYTVY